MRAELFSLRRTPSEVAELNNQSKSLYTRLDEIANTHIIIKTEVDRNPKRMCSILQESIEADDAIEGYIFANAIDTEDCRSFVDLFSPILALIEDAQECSIPFTEDGKIFEKHVNVYTFPCKGTNIKGYCFYALNKRFIALPAFETVSGVDFLDFFADAVISAKTVLKEKKKEFPTGTVTLEKDSINYYKPAKIKHNFFMSFIPHKGDSISNIITKIIVLIAIGGFIAGGIMLLNFYVFMPMGNNQVMNEIQSVYNSTIDEVIYATNDEGEVIEIKTTAKNWKENQQRNHCLGKG